MICDFDNGDVRARLRLSPHMLWNVGSVTCLHIVKRPFSEF